MKLNIIAFLSIGAISLFVNSLTHADSSTPNAASIPGKYEYDYPELTVVPRASDRLKNEAAAEPDTRFTTYLPIQLSALSTFMAGLISMDTPNYESSALGIGVGAGWLAMSTYLTLTHTPYMTGYHRIASLPKSTQREQLTAERAAEEELRRAAELGKKLKWLSWFTETGASVYMLVQFKQGAGTAHSDTAHTLEGLSLALAFAPLIFNFHWNDVYETQKDYKKRIYAPVAMATLLKDPSSQSLKPGVMLKFSF